MYRYYIIIIYSIFIDSSVNMDFISSSKNVGSSAFGSSGNASASSSGGNVFSNLTIQKIVLILAVIVGAYIIFDKISDAGLSKEFLAKQDSLTHAVDSMKLTLALDSAKIDSLNQVDGVLAGQVGYWKNHQKTITKLIDSSKMAIDTYSEDGLK